jgi:putative inorganic carbon (HCO3(-)) transporter
MAARTELPTRLLGAGLLTSALLVGIVAGYSPPVAIGLTIGLVFLIIAMANLTAGICLFAVLTFLDAILPADAQGTLSVPKLLGLVLVLSWFALITSGERERRERIFSPPAFVLVLIAFVGWAAISAAWAEDPGAAIDATTRFVPNAMLFLIVFAGVRNREQLLWVVGSLVIGAVLSAVYGMVAGAPTDGMVAGAPAGEPERVALGNANETAAALVTGGTLAAALAVALRGKPVLRLATAIAVPLCVFAVFLTLSRGGLVALGAALIAAIVMAGRRRGAVLVIAACAVLATVIYFGAFASVEARDRVLEVEGGTGRTDIWTVGWRMVEDHPLRGVGAGNFPISSIHYLLEPGALLRDDFIVDSPKVAHNTYLSFLAELGVVGLALFLGVVGFALWCAARAAGCAARAGDRQLEVLARAMVVVIIGLLAAAFFGSREYSKLIWLLLSLCPVLLEISRAELARRAGSAGAERSPQALHV